MSSNHESGYHREGEPTDNQTELQDEIDNAIYDFMQKMRLIYDNANNDSLYRVAWDISAINEIREKAESVMNLPDVY